MTNKEFDEMRFGYIQAINELTAFLATHSTSIEINEKVSIDAEIPEDYIKMIAECAVGSFNYGFDELVDEDEFDESKDYSIKYSDIDVLKGVE